MSEQEPPRIIKKYPNRRLYDTEKSQYVTLQQIRDLVLEEVPFVVIDQKSEDDITRSILLQIILEQESETNPLFSNDNLERFIRYYNAGAAYWIFGLHRQKHELLSSNNSSNSARL